MGHEGGMSEPQVSRVIKSQSQRMESVAKTLTSYAYSTPSREIFTDSASYSLETKKASLEARENLLNMFDKVVRNCYDTGNTEFASYPVIVTKDLSEYLGIDDQEDFLQALDERSHSHKACYAITINNELIIRELPSSPHETTISSIEYTVCAENIRRTGEDRVPLSCLRSRRINYVSTSPSSYEADTSFRDMDIGDPPTDQNGTVIGSIIFEIGFSESIDSLIDTGFHYLSNENVKIVISVKLIGSGNRVDELIYIILERDRRGRQNITRAVNFGPPLCETT
jgi:hypothetical protein